MLSLRAVRIGVFGFEPRKTKWPFPSGNGHVEFAHFFAPEAWGRLAGGERSGTTGTDRKGSRVPAGRRTDVRNRGTRPLQRPSRARLSGASLPVVALRSTTG
jgi:hypothetical protein